MIRQITKIPVVTPPAAEPPPGDAAPEAGGGESGRPHWLFVVAEVVLLAAIPVLGLLGFRALLDTRSGAFVVDPGPTDPGWVAVVEPTPLSLLVDVDDGRVGGAVVMVPAGEGATGGTVILVSGATEIDGRALSSRSPELVADALETALRLELGDPVELDAGAWESLLVGESLEIANPDPVVDADNPELVVVPAGRVVVEPGELAALSVRAPLVGGDPEALEFRRAVLWRTLLDEVDLPTASPVDAELVVVGMHLQQIASGVHRVEALPLQGVGVDAAAAETLIRESIVLPRGHEVGARLAVKIVDRTGTNDLEAAARILGREGFEVVQIANALVFDDGPTQLLTSVGASEADTATLAALTGAATVPPGIDTEASSVVTLLLGADATFLSSSE